MAYAGRVLLSPSTYAMLSICHMVTATYGKKISRCLCISASLPPTPDSPSVTRTLRFLLCQCLWTVTERLQIRDVIYSIMLVFFFFCCRSQTSDIFIASANSQNDWRPQHHKMARLKASVIHAGVVLGFNSKSAICYLPANKYKDKSQIFSVFSFSSCLLFNMICLESPVERGELGS